MHIGMIAPIWETIPPKGYGGIERVVDVLTRHLMARGHQVTLFTTGDSQSEAECLWTEPLALRSCGHDTWSAQMSEAIHVAQAMRHRERCDLFHNHMGPLSVAFAAACGARMVTTLHGPLLPENERYYAAYPEHPYVSISHAQRQGAPWLSYAANIYNGIEAEDFALGPKEGYLLFLGRISPEKGTHLAIETALAAGLPLIIAAKVDPFDRSYFEERIRPCLDEQRVRFVGEVDGRQKADLLSGAIGLLHLVQWPEPFGLAMVEAMASGTPVIAMPEGSIPEVVEPGVTGYIVSSVAEAAEAVSRLGALDPAACRRRALERFGAARMAEAYEHLYMELLTGRVAPFSGA